MGQDTAMETVTVKHQKFLPAGSLYSSDQSLPPDPSQPGPVHTRARVRAGEEVERSISICFGSQAPFLFSHGLSYEIRLQRHRVCGFPMGWRGSYRGAAGMLITH